MEHKNTVLEIALGVLVGNLVTGIAVYVFFVLLSIE